MKKNKFLVTLTISFLLVGLGGLASITQNPITYFLGTKVALADLDYEYYDIPAPINEPYTYPDQSIPINEPDTYTPEYQYYTPEPINEPYTYPDASYYTPEPINEPYTYPDAYGAYSGESGQSGMGFAVGTKDGEAVYQNGTTGELYTVGSDGYKQTMDANTSFTPLTASQQAAAASGQLQIGQGGVTSFTPAQIITGPDGKLYQTAGGQMVPYTGSAASGGYMSSGGGIAGALGSLVGSAIGGVGSAFNSLLGGVFGTGGTTGGYYGTTGYGGIGGIGSTGGYYGGTTGGYSSLGSYGGGTMGGMMGGTSAGGWNPANYASTGLPATSIYSIIRNLVMWALSLFGFFGIIGFVISGVWYLLAAGDDTLMKRAKNGMLYSIIGVVVGLIGLVIIYAANSLLNGSWFF